MNQKNREDSQKPRDQAAKAIAQYGLISSQLVETMSALAGHLSKNLDISRISAATENFSKIRSDFQLSLENLKRVFEKLDFSKIFGPLEWIKDQEEKAGLISQTGWLPHETTPFNILNNNLSTEEINELISEYYSYNWMDIENKFIDKLDKYLIDEEAKQTFTEALAAHRHGFYRVAPRLMFPEIERIVAKEFFEGNHSIAGVSKKGKPSKFPITRMKEIREAALDLPVSFLYEYSFSWQIFKKLQDHLYSEAGDDIYSKSHLEKDPVPNRHASLHGIVSYNTQKTSINSIIISDFIIHLITAIKNFQRLEAE